jgi:hypothetical protein
MPNTKKKKWTGTSVAIFDKRKKDIVRIAPQTFLALSLRGAFSKKHFKIIKLKLEEL